MQQEIVRIPKERVAVLIGAGGKAKRKLEKATGCRFSVDSKTGEVEANYSGNDSYRFMKALSVIKAVGRGFAPDKAVLLLNDDYTLDIIELEEIIGKSEKAMNAKKGRVIGEKGRTRGKIEKETGTYISVYGKTISIMGNMEDVPNARKSIEMLLEGAMHKTAYAYLENRKSMFEL
jgi:ribosomal RNA assembly protein